jgi:hypothetical protein
MLMAKLLTQVWKTVMGTFFETEEEAIAAENKHAIKATLVKVRQETMAPVIADYKKRLAEWEKDGRRNPSPGPNPEWEGYQVPPNFYERLSEELYKIATFKTENKDK